MSDPLETLRNLDRAPVGPHLPADEVRRRGDRMRRRRTAVRALGAACAVAVAVTGGVALGNVSGTRTAPAPAPATQAPSPGPGEPTADDRPRTRQATLVPEGFPLLTGVPDKDADSERTTQDVLSTPRIFDPCHNNADAAVDAGRTDYRRVTQTGPAHSYLRELVVYESSSAANEAMLLARGELERCPQYLYDDGVSRDVWEPAPASERSVKADDFVLMVNHGYGEAGITTLATSWTLVRVGNAILTLAYDGEFGASRAAVAEVVDRDLDAAWSIAPAMCPFADETTNTGCASTSTAAGPGEVTDDGPATLIDEVTLREATGVNGFETVPDSQMATLACQADWLSSLRPDTADYRQFEARGRNGALGAWAGTAVLGFADEAAARSAYDTVTGDWLRECDPQVDPSHQLVTAVDSGLGEPHPGETAQGRSYWRGVKLTAPETCVECDAAWDDHEGAALVGRTLVVAHVAYGGDMQLGVDDSRSPMRAVLAAAAKRTAAHAGDSPGGTGSSAPVLGPDGYGDLRLRMSREEARASTAVEHLSARPKGAACAAGRLTDGGGFYLSRTLGVAAIWLGRDMATPEGIHWGSTLAEVKAAYPQGSRNTQQYWVVPLGGGREYHFGFEQAGPGGKVGEAMLTLTDQDCFG